MLCINERRVLGYLGRDPVMRDMGNGRKVVNFTVGTSETYTDKGTNEVKKFTEWHRVTVFNQATCGLVMERLRTGSLVYVEGQNRTREFTDGKGTRNRESEIVVRPYDGKICFLDSNADEQLAALAASGFDIDPPADYELEETAGRNDRADEIPF